MEVNKFLKQLFLFDSFNGKEMKYISSFSSLINLSQGKILFNEGDSANAFFGVIEGKVKIYKLSKQGQEQIIHIQSKGSLVAEASFFDREEYPAFCEALEDSVLIKISSKEFKKFLLENPNISLKIMNSYSKRLRAFVKQVEELSFSNIKVRFANYLLDNSYKQNDKLICKLNISKKELASLLGTIPETLSRTLQYFKNKNIISENKSQIQILDKEKLTLLI